MKTVYFDQYLDLHYKVDKQVKNVYQVDPCLGLLTKIISGISEIVIKCWLGLIVTYGVKAVLCWSFFFVYFWFFILLIEIYDLIIICYYRHI